MGQLQRFLIGMFVGMMLFSCSSSVEINQYSLEPVLQENKGTEFFIDQKLGIENFSSHPAIQRQGIIVRKGDSSRVSVESHHLWWASPEEMITQSLKSDLEARRVFSHVLSYPGSHKVPYVMEGHVKRFELRSYENGWKTMVEVSLRLLNNETQKILWHAPTLKSSKPCSSDFSDVGIQMAATLQQIWQQVDQGIKNTLTKIRQEGENGKLH